MNTVVTLRNGAQHPRQSVLGAWDLLEQMRAENQETFRQFLANCCHPHSTIRSAPIRDVTISCVEGDGQDMGIVWPIRLVKPRPGQQIHALNELLDLELDGDTIIKLIDWRGQHRPVFAWLRLVTPNFMIEGTEAFHAIEMEITADGLRCGSALTQDDLDHGAQVFIACPDEIAGRRFSYQSENADRLGIDAVRKARAPRPLDSPPAIIGYRTSTTAIVSNRYDDNHTYTTHSTV
jgi:hypothetical protein